MCSVSGKSNSWNERENRSAGYCFYEKQESGQIFRKSKKFMKKSTG
jgi:hypothetical protein